MPEALTWTTDKPSQTGFYWYQTPGQRARVVEVVSDSQMKWLYVAQTGAVVDELKEDEIPLG